ncbi:RNA polymerase sigma factor [Nocardioides sp. TRM66260-LWL]|uniref:RNA polymerase sigma factor n=1 Tax=Nocardioides sp. TRM66260-LWL TaxID=2874478 RepID=UPI001CC4C9B1|nr:RNA polymerase sigma factor [Nocardioides sp. TRM66260-LWL]MBZ5735716.1 RNA polymerase sigma factor [Nocardioides sp. TRM66260-LWL]
MQEIEESPGDLTEASDDALVRAARLGDQDAFAVIVDRYGPGMYQYAMRLVAGHDADAAEVVQEAFISAWRSIGTFAGRSQLRTWLFSLVHRRAVDLLRKRRPTPIDDEQLALESPVADDDPLRSTIDAELVAALQEALATLPPTQRAVWLLRETEDMSYEEIAEALSIPVGSVRGHLHRGRRTLAERMARWR